MKSQVSGESGHGHVCHHWTECSIFLPLCHHSLFHVTQLLPLYPSPLIRTEIIHLHSTTIALSPIDLSHWSGVGLCNLTWGSITIQISFILSLKDCKRSHTLLYQELCSSFTNPPFFFLNKTQLNHNWSCRKKIQMHLQKLACSSNEKVSVGFIWCTFEKTCSTNFLQTPQLGHSCDLPLLSCILNSSNYPLSPNNCSKNLEDGSFMYLNTPQIQPSVSIPINMHLGFMLLSDFKLLTLFYPGF